MIATAVAVLAAAAPSAAVGVGLDEFTLGLYRTRVRPGVVRLNVTNNGEDPHDLAVRDRRRRTLARLPELAPGTRRTLRVRLRRAGTYTLVCTLADHERLGMRAKLKVVARKRARRKR